MFKQLSLIVSLLLVVSLSAFSQISIVSPTGASTLERLAAKEVQRYLYVRTGKAFAIQQAPGESKQAVYVAKNSWQYWDAINSTEFQKTISNLKDSDYLIHTIQKGRSKTICIVGGGDSGVLYGAYRFAEALGIRFGLHGDVVPDGWMKASLPTVNEQASPLFRIRGIQPFHDFPEGPDWWNEGEYKSILAQLPKLGMNFFAMHCYPEEYPVDPKAYPNAEPSVWIGLKDDLNNDGSVEFSYPSSWYNTARGNWGYAPKKTSAYSFGASSLFDRDDFGGEVMRGRTPQPANLEESNALFDGAGELLGSAFTFAQQIGVQTCIGAETPLTIPERLKERLTQQGRDLDNIQTTQALYEGMFRRLEQTTPIDYYWFWTPERWTWEGNSPEQIQQTKDDLSAAMRAAEAIDASFQFATCGWVLGPVQDRAMFDRFLPKNFSMSCINREVGKAPVDPAFQRIEGRSLWAIPWMEDDPNLLMPQLWAGRMRADAADALDYGCDGILGIHWRTRILDPNVQALAKAAWRQDWKRGQVTRSRNESLKGLRYVQTPMRPVNQADDPQLYLSQVEGPLQLCLDAPNGAYIVKLHFCETEATSAQQRVFHILLQGEERLSNYDLFDRAGRYTAQVESFQIQVNDEFISLQLSPVQGSPRLAAYEIEGPGFSRRVNCGGEAYQGFAADQPIKVPDYRDMPAGDFYHDWARSQFGEQAGEMAAQLFTSLDGSIPITTTWVRGPGSLKADPRAWETVQNDYAFVEQFASLRPRVRGALNQERFEYWLNQFQFQKTVAHIQCVWHQFNQKMKRADRQSESNPVRYAKTNILPLRIEMVQLVEKAYQHLLLTVSTTGGLGMVTNWEQQNFPDLIHASASALEALIGESLPDAAQVRKDYPGKERLIVLTPRSLLNSGEPLHLNLLWLGKTAPGKIQLQWRAIGDSDWKTRQAQHQARGVYAVEVSSNELSMDGVEFYAEAVTQSGEVLVAPASAPNLGWTAVVTDL